MTVNSTTSAVTYAGTGATNTFNYTWQIAQAADLVVWTWTPASGSPVKLALTTDYTVSGATVPTGGDVTLVAGNLPVGTSIFIGSDPLEIQSLLLQEGAAFNPADVMNALDLLTREVQATRRIANNALQIPVVESLVGLSTTTPIATQRAGFGLGFDASGNVAVGYFSPGGAIGGSIAAGQVAVGTALNAIGGSSSFTYASNTLNVHTIDVNNIVASGGIEITAGGLLLDTGNISLLAGGLTGSSVTITSSAAGAISAQVPNTYAFAANNTVAGQLSGYMINDAGTNMWGLLKSSTDTFQIYDAVNGLPQLTATAGAGITGIIAVAGNLTVAGEIVTAASTTAGAGLLLTPGAAPSAPVAGQMWITGGNLQYYNGSAVITPGSGVLLSGNNTWTGTNAFTPGITAGAASGFAGNDIYGRNDGNAVAAGFIGQTITNAASTPATGSGGITNVVTIALTAGVWMLTGGGWAFALTSSSGGSTTGNMWISNASGGTALGNTEVSFGLSGVASTVMVCTQSPVTGALFVTLSSTATYYLNISGTWASAGLQTAWLQAVRIG